MQASRVRSVFAIFGALMLALALFGLVVAPSAHASSTYMINYHLNGGTNPLSQYRSIAAGKTMKVSQLKEPTRTGYSFKGWYKDAKLKKAAKTVSGVSNAASRTVYAKWSAVSYKIVYNLDGGTQAAGQKKNYTIATKTFQLKAPTKDGYAFQGWCTSSSLSNSSIVTQVKKGSTGKLVLYAKWKKVWDGNVNVAGVSVKQTVNDYTWAELSTLSAAIAQTQSQSDALKIAANYHLCSAAGKLTGDETKDVVLNAGTEDELVTSVQISGFCHDTIDEDTVAGISFIFCDAVAMDMPDLYLGVWANSNLRTTLNSTVWAGLPKDLASAIVEVQKLTNSSNIYPIRNVEYVVPTTEKLWLYSVVELEGAITPDRGWSGDPDGFMIGPKASIPIYNAEGSQYQLFSDMGITEKNSADSRLARTYKGTKVSWFLRSIDPEFAYFAFVNGEENTYVMDGILGGFSNYAQKGLVPGFSI